MFQPQGVLCKDIDDLLSHVEEYVVAKKPVYENKHRVIKKYINMPCSFDIETSSFTIGDRKCAIMYIWQFGINGYACYGRTWEEFDEAMEKVRKFFNLGTYRILPVYVHNLAFEFQWIRQHFDWDNIFAREKRSPMKALTTTGFEFRCSYMLSGCSLEQTCKDLQKYKIKKKVGDLDYDLLRTPATPLTETEIGYCVYDVYCVMNYIKEEMERYEDVVHIPMTKTGKVRIRCRKECFSKKSKNTYTKMMSSLKITSIEEYDFLKRAFQGGFTHAGWLNAYIEHVNVFSFDFTSSYPTVLVAEQYPMGTAEPIKLVDEEDLENRAKTHLLIFNVHFVNLRPKFKYEHYLSGSKCWVWNSKGNPTYLNEKDKNCRMDNGRVISAKELCTTITNVDWDIIKATYEWDAVDFGHGYQYVKGYLPTEFVKTVLDLYEKKTTLKDVEGMEGEYLLAKGDINGMYGMTVTDIINDIVTYEMDEWGSHEDDPEQQLERYNNSKTRFLFYPWGVFCTAYARRNLWTGIMELGKDYIYSDTDSVKFLNYNRHAEYFKNYNNWIIMKLEDACKHHGLNPEMICPKTIKGKEKPLGVWDDEACDTPEGHLYARRFKTLGAKRYLIEYWNGEKWQLKCTIAGVNKKKTSKWFMSDYENAFTKFDNYMEVPEEYSGRLIATYIDPEDTIEADVTDYVGNVYHMKPNTGVHFAKSSYNLTMTNVYVELLKGREEEQTC